MTDRTLNGWRVRQHPGKGTFVAPNGKTVYCADDDVAEVFRYIVEQWHERIEPLPKATHNTYPNERKGYIVVHCSRPVPLNGLTNSNHLSHTAIDVLGDKHHYERSCSMANGNSCWGDGKPHPYISGFTNAQAAELRAIAAECDKAAGKPIIRLGIDFAPGWRDAMHVELAPGTTNADVARAAQFFRAARTVDNLTHVADQLLALGYTATTAGVLAFQQDRTGAPHYLEPDSVFGRLTRAALEADMASLQEVAADTAAIKTAVIRSMSDDDKAKMGTGRSVLSISDLAIMDGTRNLTTMARTSATNAALALVLDNLAKVLGHQADVRAMLALLADDITEAVAEAVAKLHVDVDAQAIAQATADVLAARLTVPEGE